MEPRQQQLERCAQLLSRRSTDDEKLAGLLLVPKVVDIHDTSALAFVLSALDARFLERLLRTGAKHFTKTTADSSTPFSESTESAMLLVAVRVIDVFAAHADVAQSPKLLDRIPTLYRVAALDIPGVSAEAAQVLAALLDRDPAVQGILERPGALADAIDGETARNVDALGYVLNRCSRFVCAQEDVERFVCAQEDVERYAHGWVVLVERAALLFCDVRDVRKFQLMSALASCLEPVDSDDARMVDAARECLLVVQRVSSGCTWILRQKSETTEYADQALVLYSHLVRLWPSHVFGARDHKGKSPEHAAAPAAGTETDRSGEGRKESELALRLACIEGQSSIDKMMIRPPPEDKDPVSVRESEAARVRLGWKYPVCAEIVSGWLVWVSRWLDDQPESSAVDEGGILELMTEVQALAQATVNFFVDWKERLDNEAEMLDLAPEIVLSAVHFLGEWLATDPKLHKAALPLISMCAAWVAGGGETGKTIAEYMRPCVLFALDMCGISEMQYVDDLKTGDCRHEGNRNAENASSWVGTIEMDDLARAIYAIPSDQDVLLARPS
ncbi:hypothetical protein GGI15_002447 [Coemansia interrupta]|uniref:Neurochondrin family protein n=1 Tax=Coemansia interrupta TaxID=1126814 RepID=A0A9W8HDN3_9FUNG|nr:hypothetical protein GGI15_002447 [Coemansia interrupta]